MKMKIKLIDKKKKDLINFKVETDVGFLDNLDPEILLKATSNEFGTDKIPERSFMRSVFDENKDKIQAKIKKLASSAIVGSIPPEDFIRKIALYIKELIVYKIETAKDWATPLHVVTIANKGHDRPLIETYEMITSVDFRINYVYIQGV